MRLLAVALILLPTLAWADTDPRRTKINNRCTSYAMCPAHSGTGECTDGTDEIVLQVGRYSHYTFYSTPSAATNYSCDIHTSDEGFDAATATDQVNSTSITDEAPVYTMAVLLRHFWVACTVNDVTVTINVVICAME